MPDVPIFVPSQEPSTERKRARIASEKDILDVQRDRESRSVRRTSRVPLQRNWFVGVLISDAAYKILIFLRLTARGSFRTSRPVLVRRLPEDPGRLP